MAMPRCLLLCLLAFVFRVGGLPPEQHELQLSSTRRGVGGNLVGPQMEALKGLGWFYNWGTRLDNVTTAAEAAALGLAYAPMQWGRWGADFIQVPPGARVLLGFNEPNHREQSNLTPREAAVSGVWGCWVGAGRAGPGAAGPHRPAASPACRSCGRCWRTRRRSTASASAAPRRRPAVPTASRPTPSPGWTLFSTGAAGCGRGVGAASTL